MGKNNKDERIIRKLFVSLIPVQAIAFGLPAICTLINGFIIGNSLGVVALSVLGYTNPLTLAVGALSSLLASGSQIVCGRALGKGDKDSIQKTFCSTMLLCVIVGCVFGALVFGLAHPLTSLLGANEDNFEHTVSFLKGYSVGIPFIILSSCFIGFLQLERKEKTITLVSIITVVITLGGNLLNVTMLGLGILGTSLFISFGSFVGALICIGVIAFGKGTYEFSFKYMDIDFIKEIIILGSGQIINALCNVAHNLVINRYVVKLGGTLGMSAMTVAYNIETALACFYQNGFFGAGITIFSVLYGNRDIESIKKLAKIMVKIGVVSYTVMYVGVFFFAGPLALLFGAEPENIQFYTSIVRHEYAWSLFVFMFAATFCLYQAMGKVKLMSIMAILCNAIIPCAYCFLLGDVIGINYVVMASSVANICFFVAFLGYYIIKTKKFPKNIFVNCYIPKSEEIAAENSLKASISTTEEAITVSKKVEEFCVEKGLSKSRAYYCALCIEEMAVDAITYRFKKKKETIDIQIIYTEENLRIIFKDDCKYFNPNEWLALCRPEDEMRSIGIKAISKLSKEMNYVNTLGLNVLTIDI